MNTQGRSPIMQVYTEDFLVMNFQKTVNLWTLICPTMAHCLNPVFLQIINLTKVTLNRAVTSLHLEPVTQGEGISNTRRIVSAKLNYCLVVSSPFKGNLNQGFDSNFWFITETSSSWRSSVASKAMHLTNRQYIIVLHYFILNDCITR